MTTSITSSTPELCDNCQQIDFSLFTPYAHIEFPDVSGCYGEFWMDGPSKTCIRDPHGWPVDTEQGSHELDLGPLEAIVARQEVCPFCHFVATTFKKSYGREVSSLPAVSSHEGTCKILLKRIRFGIVFNNTKRLPYRFRWPGGWNIPDMILSCWSKGKREDHLAFLAAPTSNSASEPTLLARYRPARCDVTLFNSWLQICATNHSQCCRKHGDATVPLRLIDVLNMCLDTTSQERSEVEYLALSYVWGGGPKEYVLTSENLQRYCRSSGLPTLPKTISDAVTLTKEMGKRYLWVDSLCIVSNDPEDKASQIPAMTSVYGNAILTIIAAAGDDANHGLPGIGSFRPGYKVADLGRYQIVQSHLNLYQRSIEQTTWATRAWTYQELILSPRSLIFFETHVEWLCRRTEWYEQLDLEHPNFNVKRRRVYPEEQVKLEISDYHDLVLEYTRRNLTFETDIVNAFAGIMAAIDDKFFWGIPYSRFGQFLAWAVERVLSEDVPDERRDCGLSIPSWSWLSCRGAIDLNSFPRVRQSLLAVYRWRSGQLEQICTPELTSLFEGSNLRQADVIWYDDSDWTVCIEDLPSDVTLNENQLIFWAPTVANSNNKEREYVILGDNMFGEDLIALDITWKDKIATRLWRVNFELEDWPVGNVVKKLIIME